MEKHLLLHRGFFPKELPPTFDSLGFAAFVQGNQLELTPPPNANQLISRPAIHNLALPGRLRRRLQVPNPLNQLELVQVIVGGWAKIQAHLDLSTLSQSKPVKDKYERRALVIERTGNDLPLIRSVVRAVGRFVVQTDIARFYHSIYTHSIPWALKGKDWAKKNRTGGLGNDLDRALRNSQDGQTLGIPVGPDTSLVIAEIIATAVDVKLQGALESGFRFMDDYEFSFPSRSPAERSLVRIEEGRHDYTGGFGVVVIKGLLLPVLVVVWYALVVVCGVSAVHPPLPPPIRIVDGRVTSLDLLQV